jgi:hypothetical protein
MIGISRERLVERAATEGLADGVAVSGAVVLEREPAASAQVA